MEAEDMPYLLLGEAIEAAYARVKGETIRFEPETIRDMAVKNGFSLLEGRQLELFLKVEHAVTEYILRLRIDSFEKPKPDPKVYFVRSSEGLIKIGFTTKPIEERLAQFRNISSGGAFLLVTVPGSKQDESFLHRTFKKDKAHGEWFNPSPRLLKTIQKLKDGASISDAVKD